MNETIYVIEGLFGEFGGWLRKPLIKNGFKVKWFPHWWVGNIPDDAILVGHSFGAARAIKLVTKGLANPRLLITIDPRLEPKGGFVLPDSFDGLCLNFYQLKGLRGFSVRGKRVENFFCPDYRHGNLPQNPWIKHFIKQHFR